MMSGQDHSFYKQVSNMKIVLNHEQVFRSSHLWPEDYDSARGKYYRILTQGDG